jgi:hypothetical protein
MGFGSSVCSAIFGVGALDFEQAAKLKVKMPARTIVVIVFVFIFGLSSGLTKKAEPPPTRDVNRDSGTDSANGGWLRRLVRPLVIICSQHKQRKHENEHEHETRTARPKSNTQNIAYH